MHTVNKAYAKQHWRNDIGGVQLIKRGFIHTHMHAINALQWMFLVFMPAAFSPSLDTSSRQDKTRA